MRDGIYLVDVLVRAAADERMSLDTLRTLQVPLPNGQTVPLSQIATFEYGQEYPMVWRRDRLPTLTVQADVVPGMQAATVVQALARKSRLSSEPAERLPRRGRRDGGGEQQGAKLGRSPSCR